MIRRDYILRMIEEFLAMLSKLQALKRSQRWQEAATTLDEQFHRLIGDGVDAVAGLSETELLARLLQGEPTQVVREKAFILTALLKEAGDVAVARQSSKDGHILYTKGLHLLLDILARGEPGEFPEFVPRIELFLEALGPANLSMHTNALLMQHYELTGQFAKAEDRLFLMLESGPSPPELMDLGIAFYQRLNSHSDAALATGNLPRVEISTGLAEMKRRKSGVS